MSLLVKNLFWLHALVDATHPLEFGVFNATQSLQIWKTYLTGRFIFIVFCLAFFVTYLKNFLTQIFREIRFSILITPIHIKINFWNVVYERMHRSWFVDCPIFAVHQTGNGHPLLHRAIFHSFFQQRSEKLFQVSFSSNWNQIGSREPDRKQGTR